MLGKVPAVWVYANRGPIKGIGVSDIAMILLKHKDSYMNVIQKQSN
jgi:hypothetical protein